MRVLIVQRFDLASVSCARRVISEARELTALGHEVTLVDMPHPRRQAEVGCTASVADLTVLSLERTPRALLRNLRRLQDAPKPDLVHLWKSYPDAAIPALLYAWRNRIPVHYDWDDWEEGITLGLTESPMSAALVSKWERAVCRWADSVSVASQALRQAALAYGCEPEKLSDLPVGVDSERFFPRPPDKGIRAELGFRGPVLVYLGQLEVASYVVQTVDVLKEVRRTHPTAGLLVIGGGRLTGQLRGAIQRAGLTDSVHITGYIDADRVPDYLSLGDVALAPFEDNQVVRCKSPLKIAEYLSMGMPVVASDVGEARTMLHGGGGRLVPPNDWKAMGRAAVELLEEDLPREQVVPDGLTWRRHAEILAQTYRGLL